MKDTYFSVLDKSVLEIAPFVSQSHGVLDGLKFRNQTYRADALSSILKELTEAKLRLTVTAQYLENLKTAYKRLTHLDYKIIALTYGSVSLPDFSIPFNALDRAVSLYLKRKDESSISKVLESAEIFLSYIGSYDPKKVADFADLLNEIYTLSLIEEIPK